MILTKHTLGFCAMIATALLWSFIGILSKYCLQEGITPLQCALSRSLFGFVAFFIHCHICHNIKIPVKDSVFMMLFGAWGIGVYYSCAQLTIHLAGAAMDIILQYTAPFWVAIFARVFFNDYLTKQKLISICLACLGTIFIVLSGGSLPTETPILGICTGLITGLCYASHYPFTKIWQKKYSSAIIFNHMLAGGSLALFVVTLSTSTITLNLSYGACLCLACLGIVCTYLAFITYGYALKRISIVQAVIITELEPVLSMLWVWLIFSESFKPLGWVGSCLIILAVLLLVVWREKTDVQ